MPEEPFTCLACHKQATEGLTHEWIAARPRNTGYSHSVGNMELHRVRYEYPRPIRIWMCTRCLSSQWRAIAGLVIVIGIGVAALLLYFNDWKGTEARVVGALTGLFSVVCIASGLYVLLKPRDTKPPSASDAEFMLKPLPEAAILGGELVLFTKVEWDKLSGA